MPFLAIFISLHFRQQLLSVSWVPARQGVRFKASKRKQLFTQVSDRLKLLASRKLLQSQEAHTSLGKGRKALKDLNGVIIQTNQTQETDVKTKSLHQNKGKASHAFAQFLLFPRCLASQAVPSLLGVFYLLGGFHSSWTGALGRTLSPAALTFCSSLPISTWQGAGYSGRVGDCSNLFYWTKQHSQTHAEALPSGTPAAMYSRHQSRSLRALLQSRWWMWPETNCKAAHKQQELALALLPRSSHLVCWPILSWTLTSQEYKA